MAIHSDPPTGPAGLVSEAAATLGSVAETLWAARTPGELVAAMEALEAVKSQITALQARILHEVDGRGVAKSELHWGSTADWVTHLCGLRRGEGHRVLTQARHLVTEQTATLAALDEGRISPTQAALVVHAVQDLPGNPFLRRRGEAHLLDLATRMDASDLARAGRHLVHVVDPDRQDRKDEAALGREERAAHQQRFLSVRDDGAGGVRIAGRGSAEDCAVLRAALLPFTRPQPGSSSDEQPGHALADQAGAHPDQPSVPGADPRDHGARLWDALVQLARHALDSDLPPDSHGARPRVTVTIPLGDLLAGLGVGRCEDGTEVSAETVRRWACDADLIPVTLGTNGELLDVGRRHRLVTRGLWAALVVRDEGCAFPGCARPPVMCQAHHIRHWGEGGATRLDNLVLLCGHHHRVIHHTPWAVGVNPTDGRADFTPPPRRAHHPAPGPVRDRPRRE